MRLAGRVADRETRALAPRRADPGYDRPDRKPSAFAPSSGEREVLDSGLLDVEEGLLGDRWARGKRRRVQKRLALLEMWLDEVELQFVIASSTR